MGILSKVIKGAVAFSIAASAMMANEVNVYSHRHYDSDKELFAKFSQTTGIKVNVVTAKAEELVAKLAIEGTNTPADMLITADIGNLYEAKERGLLQSVTSNTLNQNIPAHLRDDAGEWYGLTKRARVFVYNPAKVDPKDLSDYMGLTDPKLKGKIITRTSTNAYNKSLLASIIANHGEAKALEFTKGLVANFARDPKGNDRDQIRAVAAGDGDIAIVNTYYLGIMLNSKDTKDVEIANSVKIFFPAQDAQGTHMNISGAGVTKYAKNKENAVKLIEFLSSTEAQTMFAEANHEFPVNEAVKASGTVASWGEFKEDQLPLNEVGKYNKKAVEIATHGNWK
ncbi:Fe(3+) ABC transporter substrate-binding protein [Arcobacter sp. FWKO B]|uniref:Fe(3+) ABC transporter substrate-binding protein n=1 Tax=Arcobacter sp. FWKO B TaxID=2593672 RepID=UPI0018A5C363|nr:Fe(3+) ABC transporter substrate-binding protein [Arcobacter sp. FWKO B]QOG11965.1 Fe(3+) ABC transporter substrate-binding protein [Arcobacter sp. FWKO B]